MNRHASWRTAGDPPMASAYEPEIDAEADAGGPDFAATLRELWSAAYRNRLTIVAIVGVAILLGLAATLLMTPHYRATASVQVDQQSSDVLGAAAALQPATADYQDADRFLQTQVDVLRSRALAIRVMNSLGLGNGDGFVLAMGRKPVVQPKGRLTLAESRREQIVGILQEEATIDMPRNSRVVTIGFTSPEPVLAARIANSYAINFIQQNLKRKFDESAYARDFLRQQLVGAKQRLEDSERAALDYSRRVGLIDASAGIGNVSAGAVATGTPRSLVTSDLVSLNAAFSEAQAARVAAQQRWEQAQRTPLLSLPDVLANPAIAQLTQLRGQAQAAYDQDATRHRADFPTLQQLRAQLQGYDQQIGQLAASIRDSIRSQYLTAAKQEAALASAVGGLKRDTLSEQQKSVQYNILRRETDTNRTMYDGLLQRFKEVSAQSGITANNISIVDRADVPVRPVSPRPLLNLLIAIFVGLLVAAATVLVREKFDDAVRSPGDVQDKLGLTLLNTVPKLRQGDTPAEAVIDPRSALSESYAALRTALELVDGEGMPRSLLFTSSRTGEGKSTSAYAIARDFARLGRRVVLIDADLRRPSLHRMLGLPNNAGLASVLARHRALSEVIQQTDVPDLSFLSTGPLPPSPAELLSGALLKPTFRTLANSFDLVIVDGPPVLGLADAVILANQCGGTVFVIEANGSHHGHAKAAIRRLATGGAHILGALLTKYDAKRLGYGNGYGYGYENYNYGVDLIPSRTG